MTSGLPDLAGQETRLLLLGAGARLEPVNGHQIRRELLSRLRETIEEVRAGRLAAAWTPATDDPGWQLNADHERYRALLEG